MSAPEQRQSSENGESAHSLHGKLAHGAFDGEREPDAGGVKSGRCDSKSCSIAEEAGGDRFGAVCVAMLEQSMLGQSMLEEFMLEEFMLEELRKAPRP